MSMETNFAPIGYYDDKEKIKFLESDLHRYKHLDAEHERAKVEYGKLVESLESRVAELEGLIIQQANMICKKANENSALSRELADFRAVKESV